MDTMEVIFDDVILYNIFRLLEPKWTVDLIVCCKILYTKSTEYHTKLLDIENERRNPVKNKMDMHRMEIIYLRQIMYERNGFICITDFKDAWFRRFPMIVDRIDLSQSNVLIVSEDPKLSILGASMMIFCSNDQYNLMEYCMEVFTDEDNEYCKNTINTSNHQVIEYYILIMSDVIKHCLNSAKYEPIRLAAKHFGQWMTSDAGLKATTLCPQLLDHPEYFFDDELKCHGELSEKIIFSPVNRFTSSKGVLCIALDAYTYDKNPSKKLRDIITTVNPIYITGKTVEVCINGSINDSDIDLFNLCISHKSFRSDVISDITLHNASCGNVDEDMYFLRKLLEVGCNPTINNGNFIRSILNNGVIRKPNLSALNLALESPKCNMNLCLSIAKELNIRSAMVMINRKMSGGGRRNNKNGNNK